MRSPNLTFFIKLEIKLIVFYVMFYIENIELICWFYSELINY